MQGKDAIDPNIIVAKTTQKEILAIATPVLGDNGKPIGTATHSSLMPMAALSPIPAQRPT